MRSVGQTGGERGLHRNSASQSYGRARGIFHAFGTKVILLVRFFNPSVSSSHDFEDQIHFFPTANGEPQPIPIAAIKINLIQSKKKKRREGDHKKNRKRSWGGWSRNDSQSQATGLRQGAAGEEQAKHRDSRVKSDRLYGHVISPVVKCRSQM